MGNKEDERSMLANALFARSLFITSKKLIYEAVTAYDEGFVDLAYAYNQKAMKLFSSAILMSPSPNLTLEENKEYLTLMNKRNFVNNEGELKRRKINENEKERLLKLRLKVFPDTTISLEDI